MTHAWTEQLNDRILGNQTYQFFELSGDSSQSIDGGRSNVKWKFAIFDEGLQQWDRLFGSEIAEWFEDESFFVFVSALGPESS